MPVSLLDRVSSGSVCFRIRPVGLIVPVPSKDLQHLEHGCSTCVGVGHSAPSEHLSAKMSREAETRTAYMTGHQEGDSAKCFG